MKEFVVHSSIGDEPPARSQIMLNLCELRPGRNRQRQICIGRSAIDSNAMCIAQVQIAGEGTDHQPFHGRRGLLGVADQLGEPVKISPRAQIQR